MVNNKKLETLEAGVEVYCTFKLTEEVTVSADWVVEETTTYPEGVTAEARNRLERAGLPRDLQELDC